MANVKIVLVGGEHHLTPGLVARSQPSGTSTARIVLHDIDEQG